MGKGVARELYSSSTMIFRSIDKKRLIVGGILLVCVFVLPSLLTLLIGALLTLRYTRYYEFAIAALLIDALYRPYGFATIGLFGFALGYILIIDHLRIRIRMRDDRRLY